MRFGACCLFAFLLVAALAIDSHADVLTIDAFDAGFVTSVGGSAKGDGTASFPATFNYSVGQAEHFIDGALGPILDFNTRKNYFGFDFSTVSDPIVSASLMLYMGPDTPPDYPEGEHGYNSLDPFEDYVLKGTSDTATAGTIMAGLLMSSLFDGIPAFDDPDDPAVLAAKDLHDILGDGPVLGSITTTSMDDDTFLMIELGDAGIDYLNLYLGGTAILAGELTSIGAPDTTELIFGFTGPDILGGTTPGFVPKLTIETIPEPSSLLPMIALSLVFARRRT